MIKKLLLAAALALLIPFAAHAQPSSGGSVSIFTAKGLIDFHSDVGALAGGAIKIFSPDGTRNTYYDMQGFSLLNVAFTDNSPGAAGGTLYIRWSRTGASTPFNDPGDGTGLTNYVTAVNSTTDGLVVTGRLIPLAARYANFVYVNNATAQGNVYPQLCEIRVDLNSLSFSSNVAITNTSLPVVGAADPAIAIGQPVVVGGRDAAGTGVLTWLLNASGHGTVAQGSTATASNNGWKTEGEIAHDTADTTTNNPVIHGARGIAHGTTPTAVTANDVTRLYANREGLPWVMAGAPNIVTIRANYAAAQTDTAIVTVGAGTKIVVTRCTVANQKDTTVGVTVRIGFGAATTPAATGVVLANPGLNPAVIHGEGDGSGMLGVGADGEDLRITSTVPTTGSIDVVCSYYTTAS